MYILNFNTVGGNGIGGADPQLLQTLADKFHFKFEFKVAARGFVEAINMVGFVTICDCNQKNKSNTNLLLNMFSVQYKRGGLRSDP